MSGTRQRLFKTWEALCIAVAAGAVCLSFSGVAIWLDLSRLEERFKQRADILQHDIAHRFGSSEAVLTALVGLHHASDELRSYEFAALTGELLSAYPHIRTVAGIRPVAASDRARFESSMRSAGFSDFRIAQRQGNTFAPADSRPIMMPIRLLEPLEPELAPLIGLDIFSETALADAAQLAIATGDVVASTLFRAPITGDSILVFKATYLGHRSPSSTEARKSQVSGLVALILQPEIFFGSLLEPRENGRSFAGFGMRVTVVADGEQGEQIVFERNISKADGLSALFGPLTFATILPAHGKSFLLEVTSTPDIGGIRVWLVVLFLGISATACGFLVLAMTNHRARVVRAREDEFTLRENQERFRDYAEIASDWFWATDSDLRFTYFSKELTMATGLFPGAFLGESRAKLGYAATDDEEAAGRHLADLAVRRPFKDYRYRHVQPDGQTKWWSFSGKPVFDEGGLFVGYRGTVRDVTMEVEAQTSLQLAKEQAELANRAKSEFIANMSHELRTPLNAIIGFSEVMTCETLGPIGSERYRQYAKDINESGHHLLSLINDILDLAKVESGSEELHEEKVDVAVLMTSLVKFISHHAEKAEVSLALNMPHGIPDIIVDKRKLKQILVNLLSNAVKFTRPGGKATLEARYDSRTGYVLRVIDTGIGIAPEGIPKVFQKFGQIDSDLNRRYQGTGLGLPLAKALTELHGGSIELESEPGRGTTVTIFLPVMRAVQPVPQGRSRPSNRRAVL